MQQYTPQRDRAVYRSSFRSRRLARFLTLVDAQLLKTPTCRILDLGGQLEFWQGLEPVWGDRSIHVTIVNQDPPHTIDDPRFDYIQGDARNLRHLQGDSFDIVHSNSVIEHVGNFTDMSQMANEVHRLAPAYFVQTPNFWFPIEPHLRAPFIHWLPKPLQAQIVMRKSLGFFPRAYTMQEAHDILADSSMLSASMMQALFPDAEIVREKVWMLTKSLIAIRRAF